MARRKNSKKTDSLISDKTLNSETNTNFSKNRDHFLLRLRRRILKHLYFVRGVILGSILLVLILISQLIYRVYTSTNLSFYLHAVSDFVRYPQEKVRLVDGKVNFLILGKSGGSHSGPDLTDTMMFVSINPNTKSIKFISIPRDIWLTDLKTKINSTYYWGNKKEVGGGLKLAKSTVEEVLGQPIEYTIVFDFTTFKKVIDEIGGVEVNVENSFTDYKFPIEGREDDTCSGDKTFACRYEVLTFTKGTVHMDGETALKFSRSRNAEGDEGTDFARALRQQKVIEAVKDKLLSMRSIKDIKTFLKLQSIFESEVETNIDRRVYGVLARIVFESKDSVTDIPFFQDLLKLAPRSTKYDNLYTFIPEGVKEDDDWSKVHFWTECVLNNRTDCDSIYK